MGVHGTGTIADGERLFWKMNHPVPTFPESEEGLLVVVVKNMTVKSLAGSSPGPDTALCDLGQLI